MVKRINAWAKKKCIDAMSEMQAEAKENGNRFVTSLPWWFNIVARIEEWTRKR